MTVASEDAEDYLVRVRAQVMTRDDSTGGWVPMDGGGLSNVSVCKREISIEEEPKNEYLIYGNKLSDQSIILSCVIKKDFEYNKVMPTFHHWKTGNKKFGLTFQTAADARAFDKGVKTAVEELIDGFAAQYKLINSLNHVEDVGDDDVFMTLNLPVERGDSRSSSDSSTGKTPPPPPPLAAVTEQDIGSNVSYGYKQLTTVHEFSRPIVDENKMTTITKAPCKDSDENLKKKCSVTPQSLSTKVQGSRKKERCRFCHEPFYRDSNQRGSCEYAPDCVKNAINTISCVSCAQCMLYHCMSDPEGDYDQPCFCNTADDQWTRRWIGLALLSLIVPCLCCYPPLRACHMGCITCGICGGRHAPVSQ
ncbi:sprouty-related, EVH1 domain-containing protein 2 [Cimex lectularius]|uniref:WH1 domain-containing protein n=1 Tax=Cimex lectularius TaxID=79782 RepID=A0A8I6RX33_CIMLE|nr:sprouty-related, EVH1 domain-containing protein 2 [Cimex lectularius]